MLSWLQAGGGPPARGFELHVFDREGALQWKHTDGNASLSSTLVTDEGSVWTSRSSGPGDYHGARISGPAAADVYADFTPLGPPDDAGLVPGQMVLDEMLGTWVLGWLDPQANTWTSVDGMTSTWYRQRDGGFVFRSGDDLVLQTPGLRTELVALGEHADLQPTYGNSEDWLLLANGERTTWARVDLAGGTVSALDLDAPGAHEPMSCYGIEASIDPQGRVLVPSRDASTAEVLRLHPDDGTWEPLGLPVTNIEALHADPFGEAVLIRADGPGTTFCPPPEFDPAPDVLEGSQTILDLPDLEPLVIPELQWFVSVRADGQCVAYSDGSRSTTLLDPVSNETLALPPNVGIVYVQ